MVGAGTPLSLRKLIREESPESEGRGALNEVQGVQALIPGTWKRSDKGQATREAAEARAFQKEEGVGGIQELQ